MIFESLVNILRYEGIYLETKIVSQIAMHGSSPKDWPIEFKF